MKLPRDISGFALVKALQPLGYSVTRQTGSHIRLTTESNGTHHITIDQRTTVTFAAIPPDTYSVSATVSGGNGTVSCSPASVPAGGSSSCTAVPDQGYGVAVGRARARLPAPARSARSPTSTPIGRPR